MIAKKATDMQQWDAMQRTLLEGMRGELTAVASSVRAADAQGGATRLEARLEVLRL